ncbi:MAG: beta-lactamase family protein, partial [Rivularia sp. ALOHA_DT_140]|nr:beta-lactamase family protein [Rivularia sp. ALOHA_DT_140]
DLTSKFSGARCELVENGLLSLEDTVNKWLPKIPFPNSVTLRRLLNHTGGVPDYTSLKEYLPSVRENPSIPWTHNKVAELTCSGKLDFEPGRGFNYSNTGYMLLYKVIEAVTKKSFAAVLQEEIFSVLNLKNTYVAREIDKKGILTPGYCRFLNSEIKMENEIPRYHPDWCATGLIVSNVEDVVKFFDAVFSGKLLNNHSLIEMQTLVDIGVRQRWYRKACYGLGIMADPESKYGIKYGHGGDGPGYNTFAMHLPDFCGRKLSLAIFCNTSMMEHPYGMITDLMRTLRDE